MDQLALASSEETHNSPMLRDEEVWDMRSLPSLLDSSLTGRAPLTMALPVEPDRETLAQLFSDPVWQLS